jgi:hypothetical protein
LEIRGNSGQINFTLLPRHYWKKMADSPSVHTWMEILSVALLRLRFYSIRNDKSGPNLSVKTGTSVNSESLISFVIKR